MQLPILVVNNHINIKVIYNELLSLLEDRVPSLNIKINAGGIIFSFYPPSNFFPIFSVEYGVRHVLNYPECSAEDINYIVRRLRSEYNPTSSVHLGVTL